MKQTKQFLRPLLMAIVMMAGMLVPQGASAQELWVEDETRTISSNESYESIEVHPGGVLIINEGVTLTVTSYLYIHDYPHGFGTVINYGTIKGEGSINMDGGVLANHGHIDLGGADGYGTFYNTGTLGDGYFNLTTTPCDHDYEDFTVDATCTHGAGTQYRCYTCYYMWLDETSGALPHNIDSHNGMNICSSCGHTTYDEPAYGDGSEEYPYQITNAGNLYWFADYTRNEDNYANAILTADIVLNDGTFATDGTFTATGADEPSKPFPWICIGGVNGSYGGTFDGNGHTISGMYVNDSFGLFYDLSGSVVNLGIVNCYIRADDYTGAICHWNKGTISNCYTTGILSGSYSSGICDTNTDIYSTISNCYSTCTFVYDTNFYGGGICGTNSGTISNCYTSDNTAIKHNNKTASEVYGGVSAERFASGEIAYKLNGSVDGEGNWTAGATNGTQAWYQKLGENGDSYPVLAAAEGKTVYYGYEDCLSESETYSNDLRYAEKEDSHDYKVLLDENEKPVFVWSEDYTSATLQLVCSRDAEHTAGVKVTGEGITSAVTTPATCTAVGVRTYTATATYKDETYTGTKELEISIDPDAHAYQVLLDENSNPVFVWSGDYTTATLQVVCLHHAEHTANVEVTGEDIITWVDTPATCTTTGVRTYTATATYEGEEYTGTKEVEIAALGHSFDEETDPDHTHCTVCNHWMTYYTTTGEDIAGIEERVGAVDHYFKEGNGYFETEECFTSVPEGAFFDIDQETTLGLNLKSISLPFVTRVENDAFNNCQSLESVTLPNVTTVGVGAFAMCKALTAISLPEATTIGTDAFSTDITLESISLPKAITIGDYAFDGCPNLTELTLPCNFDLDRESVGLGENESVTISRVHKGESVIIEGVLATCTEDGYEAYEGCSVCLEPFGEKTVNPALGHTSVTDEAIPATCTESGRTEGSHCEVCGEVIVAQEVIPASGHTPVTDEGKDATCVEPGLTAGSHCSVCDNVLVAQEEIPALGHDFSEEKSLLNNGYHRFVCTREGCGALSEDKYAKMFGEYRKVTGNANPTETIQLTKVGNYYYTSLYTDFPYTMSEDVEALEANDIQDDKVEFWTVTDIIPANCGIILRSQTKSKCTITYDAAGAYLEDRGERLLTGSETEVSEPADNQYAFGLSDTGYLGFWHWAGMTIPAWKAYLDLGSETATEARGFRIVFDDETNGIQQLPADASAIEGCYDLMGRKVREVKGLGIVNGRKVYVK